MYLVIREIKVFKAAIFDMDGLMIDSERLTLDVYKIYMATLGLSITKEFYVTMTGRTLRDCKKLLKDEYGQDFDSDLCIEKVYSMCADKIKEEGVALKKGLIKLLTYLKENNCKTILASSSNRDKVDLIINKMKLTDYLDDSICGDEVNIGKYSSKRARSLEQHRKKLWFLKILKQELMQRTMEIFRLFAFLICYNQVRFTKTRQKWF